MLAIRYAAVTARGCSSAVTATVSAAGSGSAAAAAVAASASTSAGAGAARAKLVSRGCSRLIAPTSGFLSHRLAPLNLALLSFSSFFFPSLCSFACSRSLVFHTGCSRDGRVCYAHDGRAFREESSRPTDPPTMAAVPLGVEGSTREATRRDATRASL